MLSYSTAVPQNLIKPSFTDLKDAECGKFIYEDLPKLREVMDAVIDEKNFEN